MKMRLFLGMFAKIDSYLDLVENFKPYYEGKWVEEENLHVTLYFLGEQIDPDSIIEKIDSLPVLNAPIPIEGICLSGEKNQVLYGTLSNTFLNEMNTKFQALFGKQTQPFHPHVTLCRVKRLHENSMAFLESHDKKSIGSVEAPVCLIQSELDSRGPAYSVIQTF